MTETAHEEHLPPKSSIKRWLVTTNHKDVGILYILTSLGVMALAGALAMLIRLQLFTPGESIMSAYAYNEAVTIHGLLMALWFLSPLGIGFANYVLPLQIGADDLAFPRLNALSYWIYLSSAVLAALSFFVHQGSLAAGWTMYAPLSLPTFDATSLGATTAVMAAIMFVISVSVGSFNFLTTIFLHRAEGMGLWDMPLFTWSIFLTIWMMLFAFAAFLAALIILGADHVIGTVVFQPEASGSLLWAHLFWFFGHPEVYIVLYPALGVMFEVFQTFSGRRIVGRKWVIIALILIAIQSFVVWMHHMFLTAINLEIKTLMMAMTIAISLPFDLLVFALIYTLIKGKIRFTTPFLFAFGALILFIIGGITGVFLGAIVLDYELRGTYFVVAHFHYTMAGTMTALIAGVYYWYPKITGKMYNVFLGKLHFGIFFIGFNMTYLGMFTGWETPRRVFDYQVYLTTSHQISSIGAFLMGFSFLIMFYNLGRSYFTGSDAGPAPWEYARSAEWAVPSPVPLENWPGRPSYATGHLQFLDSNDEPIADGGTAAESYTDGGTVTESHDHGEHADHASIWPFAIGTSMGAMFFGLAGLGRDADMWGAPSITAFGEGFILYEALFLIGIAAFLYSCWGFGKESFTVPAPSPSDYEQWPFEGVSQNKLGTWFFLASDVVVFGALIAGYAFMRVAHDGEWAVVAPSAMPGLINTLVLVTSSFFVVLALHYARHGDKKRLLAYLSGTVVLGLTFLGIKAWEWSVKFAEGATPWAHEAHPYALEASIFYLITSMHGLHVILGLLVAGFMLFRIWKFDAYLGSEDDAEPVENFGLYWHFVDIVWVFLFPIFYLM